MSAIVGFAIGLDVFFWDGLEVFWHRNADVSISEMGT
jgi:hypothetical protein